MNRWCLFSFIFLVCLPLPVVAPAISPDSPRLTPVVKAVSAAAPAVVNITSSRMSRGTPLEMFFGNGFGPFGETAPRKRASLGSGVIVDGQRGLVLTNAHVVANGDEIMAHLQDGREYKATIRGFNPDFDIAVLELAGAPRLPALPLGDSSDAMPGETVIAIGNPFGFAHTVTTGVISALNRSIRHSSGILTELIQTDAAINPGNSGGPLINLEGALIGINTAIDARGEGIGFAIPIDKARRVMEGLAAGGKVAPLWLGIRVEDADPRVARALGLSEPGGALVAQIYENTPAAKAGLRPGDVIRGLGGAPLRDAEDYLGALRNQTQHEIDIGIIRDGKQRHLKIMPAPFSDELAAKLMERRWGFRAKEQRRGVQVQSTREPAAFLRKGDLIRAVGQRRVENMADLLEAFRMGRMAAQVVLTVERGGRVYYARLTP